MYFLCTIHKCQSYNTLNFVRFSIQRNWYYINHLVTIFTLSCNNLIIQTDLFKLYYINSVWSVRKQWWWEAWSKCTARQITSVCFPQTIVPFRSYTLVNSVGCNRYWEAKSSNNALKCWICLLHKHKLTKRQAMLHCCHYVIQTISTMLLRFVATLKLTLAPIVCN